MPPPSYERPGLKGAPGYVPGEQPAGGVKLNTNENPYPPPPAVADALARFPVERLRRYPPADAAPFRAAAARAHGVDPAEVIAANGGDELLRLAVATYADPGAPVAIAPPTYSLYRVLIRLHGARAVEVPLAGDWGLPDRFAESLNRSGARLAFLPNPHAPSGRLYDREEIAAVAERFEGVLLVDEAYVDFVDPARGYDLTPAIRSLPNLLILRTLSKGYSLAGLRFGYGLGPAPLLEPMLTKTKDSYNVDAIAQALAAAALESRAWAEDNWAKVRAERERLRAGLERLGLPSLPSETNFVLASVPAGAAGAAAPGAGGGGGPGPGSGAEDGPARRPCGGGDGGPGDSPGPGDGGAETGAARRASGDKGAGGSMDGSSGDSDSGANALYRALKSRGVHVRWFDEPRLRDRLRISVGTREENDRLLAALAEVLPAP